MSETAQTLVAYCRENNRVCPMPAQWAAMSELLFRQRDDSGDEPPVPLILGGWDSPNLFKMVALTQQLEWAEQRGCLLEVSEFLRGLKEADWHHVRD